jgi:myo-inositol 2-dehydrogenase/D-chiro-inositol 1-dehydrogenase
LKEDQVVNTEDSAGIEQVSAEVELGRKLVQLGFMRRFDKQHLAVKEAVDSGSIGSPLLFKGWHRNPHITAHFIASDP